jgi:hypothetical protein
MKGIHIITRYYKVKTLDEKYNIDQQLEIDSCLLENVTNKYVHKIHLLTEQNYDLSFIPDEHLTKTHQVVIDKEITYKVVFDYYNANLQNEICVLLNADIYLDDYIKILNHDNFENLFIYLHQRNTNSEGTNLNSCWAWKSTNINSEGTDFKLGAIECDYQLARILHAREYKVIYPFSDNLLDKLDKYNYETQREIPKLGCDFKKITVNPSQVISSSHFDEDTRPFNSNFETPNYWRPDNNDKSPYLQYNFENLYEIAYIDIKGKNVDKNDLCFAFVKTFKISYMNIDNRWISINKTFEGITMTTHNYVKRIYLDEHIECKKIRLLPIDSDNFCALQVCLYAIYYKKPDIFDYVSKNKAQNYKYMSVYFNYKTILENISFEVDMTTREINIQNDIIREGVCLFIHVMNRTNNILNNLDSWIKQSVNQIIIIDWSSDEEFYDLISAKNDVRILYVRVNNETTFNRTLAQNLAMSLCGYSKICKIDSDIILYDDFFENHPLENGQFYVGEWLCARDDNEKKTHGLTYLFLNDMVRINGYNEYIDNYGWDDSDLTIRLMLCGLEKKLFNMDFFYHVPHDNFARIANLGLNIHPEVLTRINKYCIQEMNFWSRQNKCSEYSILSKSDNYIRCERIIEEDMNVVSGDIYDSAYKKALLEVFQWYWRPSDIEHKKAFQTLDYIFMATFLESMI